MSSLGIKNLLIDTSLRTIGDEKPMLPTIVTRHSQRRRAEKRLTLAHSPPSVRRTNFDSTPGQEQTKTRKNVSFNSGEKRSLMPFSRHGKTRDKKATANNATGTGGNQPACRMDASPKKMSKH